MVHPYKLTGKPILTPAAQKDSSKMPHTTQTAPQGILRGRFYLVYLSDYFFTRVALG